MPLRCALLDLIYALTSNPKIAVLSVPLGTTALECAYTAQIIKVLDDGHKFVEPLPVAYVHTQSERNVRFTDVYRWAAVGQIVDRFEESAALVSYLVKLLAHLYPRAQPTTEKPLEHSQLNLVRGLAPIQGTAPAYYHQIAEKSSSRKLGFRHLPFPQTGLPVYRVLGN